MVDGGIASVALAGRGGMGDGGAAAPEREAKRSVPNSAPQVSQVSRGEQDRGP